MYVNVTRSSSLSTPTRPARNGQSAAQASNNTCPDKKATTPVPIVISKPPQSKPAQTQQLSNKTSNASALQPCIPQRGTYVKSNVTVERIPAGSKNSSSSSKTTSVINFPNLPPIHVSARLTPASSVSKTNSPQAVQPICTAHTQGQYVKTAGPHLKASVVVGNQKKSSTPLPPASSARSAHQAEYVPPLAASVASVSSVNAISMIVSSRASKAGTPVVSQNYNYSNSPALSFFSSKANDAPTVVSSAANSKDSFEPTLVSSLSSTRSRSTSKKSPQRTPSSAAVLSHNSQNNSETFGPRYVPFI